jgi:hypothetical protein
MIAERFDVFALDGWRVDAQLSYAREGYTGQSVMLWGPEGVPVAIAADEAAAARRILAQLPATPLYARIDLIRNQDGVPCLMELELVEPSLFFEAGPGSAARFVDALVRRVGGG